VSEERAAKGGKVNGGNEVSDEDSFGSLLAVTLLSTLKNIIKLFMHIY